MIHVESANKVYNKKNIPFWLLSAFKAGYINSAGFLLTGEFVSHVTGFGTRVGITMGHEDYFFGAELLLFPFSFIIGGFVTSLMLDKEYEKNELPPYHLVQSLITVLIGVIIILGELNLYTDNLQFGSDGRYSLYERFTIFLLCFICGLKNGLVSWATFGKVRVTHLTGLSTDIGLNLRRMLKKNTMGHRFDEPIHVNYIRIFIVFAFSGGALISAMMFPKIGHMSFVIAFILSLVMTFLAFKRNAVIAEQLLTD